MFKKPWKFVEGFLFGGCLIVFGLLLQVLLGPVKWSLYAWPVNIFVFCLLLSVIALFYVLRDKVRMFDWMMHYHAAVPAISYALVLTIIMGLTVQVPRGGILWLSQMLSFWPFVLIYVWMVFIAGLATLNHLMHFRLREIPFILNHLGVFLAVTCATLGNPDLRELEMTLYPSTPEMRAEDENGVSSLMDFSVELRKFSVEYYPDGTPRRFASDICVDTRDGRSISGVVEVNKPLHVDGWRLYQYAYDVAKGGDSEYSVLLLVRDPWLPAVYTGIFMMLAGALCLMFFMAPKPVKKNEEGQK